MHYYAVNYALIEHPAAVRQYLILVMAVPHQPLLRVFTDQVFWAGDVLFPVNLPQREWGGVGIVAMVPIPAIITVKVLCVESYVAGQI